MEVDASLTLSMSVVLTICSLGIIGNGLCIWVLLQKEMKSSYRYLLLGLGLSDLFLLILSVARSLSNLHLYTIYYNNPWVGYPIFFWDWISTSGTKYFTVAISLERYFVICYPLVAHRYMTDVRSKAFAGSVCLFTVFLSVLSYFYNFHWDPTSFHVYVAVVLHFLPFFAVLVLNLFIYLGLKKYQQKRKALTDSESSEVSVTRMLLVIVVVLGVCYSFEFLRRTLNFTGHLTKPGYDYYDYPLNHLADIFYVLNSSVNFIVYFLMGNAFRIQFLKLVKNICSGGTTTTMRFLSGASSSHNGAETSTTPK